MPAAHAGYARHRPELLALGVELYELRATPSRRSRFLGSSKSSRSSLHAKAILVDGRVLSLDEDATGYDRMVEIEDGRVRSGEAVTA